MRQGIPELNQKLKRPDSAKDRSAKIARGKKLERYRKSKTMAYKCETVVLRSRTKLGLNMICLLWLSEWSF